LSVKVLQYIYDRIGRKVEKLAGLAVSSETSLDSLESLTQKGTLSFAQLRVFNEALAYLSNLAFVEGIHPLPAYLELCRLVGQLSIFHASRRPPDLPRYNHDDLGGCFYAIRNYLDELVDIAVEPDYDEADFIGRGLRMQVDIKPTWLDKNVPMYIRVTSPLEPDLCAKKLEDLGTKVSSADRVEMIFRRRDVGLQFMQVPTTLLHQTLPRDAGPSNYFTYFQINRELQQNEWQAVESSKTLAIRFKEDIIVGKIEGERELTLRLSSDMTFRFKLYVLVRGGAGAKPSGRS
jgi:type VI secretion system protein ImpJ